jgi:hypothetical protein
MMAAQNPIFIALFMAFSPKELMGALTLSSQVCKDGNDNPPSSTTIHAVQRQHWRNRPVHPTFGRLGRAIPSLFAPSVRFA